MASPPSDPTFGRHEQGMTAVEAFRQAAANAFGSLADQLFKIASQNLVAMAFGSTGTSLSFLASGGPVPNNYATGGHVRGPGTSRWKSSPPCSRMASSW